MNTSLRTAFALLVTGGALAASAVTPGSTSSPPEDNDEYVGTWITWYETVQGPMSPCTRMYVGAEDDTTLDGMWATPGWNGLMRGTVLETRAGLSWRGEWRTGETSGGFQFTLGYPGDPAGRFRGTYTTVGTDQVRYWNGAREVEGQPTQVPCTFAP